MWNSRRSLRILSVTSLGTKVGEVKMNSSDVDLLQLRLQRLKGVDREAGGRDLQLGAGLERLLEVVAEQVVDVVDDFHQRSSAFFLLLMLAAIH